MAALEKANNVLTNYRRKRLSLLEAIEVILRIIEVDLNLPRYGMDEEIARVLLSKRGTFDKLFKEIGGKA